MPKIDARTGCEVMTQAEFWQSEAFNEGKGREGADLYQDFMADMEADLKAEENALRQPDTALGVLQRCIGDWNEADPEAERVPMPVEVLEVLNASIQSSFKSNGLSLSARVRALAGVREVQGVVTVHESSFSGSWDEPPDYDVNVQWEA